MTDNYILTTERLAVLGILDETLDLYKKLEQIVDVPYGAEKVRHPKASPLKYNKLCIRHLNQFFEKHRHFFGLADGTLINKNNMSNFSMYSVRFDRRSHGYVYDKVSFKSFLQEIEQVARSATCQRIYREKPKTPYENAVEFFNANIIKAIEEKVLLQALPIVSEEECTYVYEASTVVYVYGSTHRLNCIVNEHEIKSTSLWVPLLKEKCTINLPVQYCNICKKYYVSEITLSAFEGKYGALFLYKKAYDSLQDTDYARFRSESELHSWGYNVVRGKSSEAERRALMITLMRYRHMSKEAICRDIENAIRIFQNNLEMRDAVKKWKADLVFVREYQLKEADKSGYLVRAK